MGTQQIDCSNEQLGVHVTVLRDVAPWKGQWVSVNIRDKYNGSTRTILHLTQEQATQLASELGGTDMNDKEIRRLPDRVAALEQFRKQAIVIIVLLLLAVMVLSIGFILLA